MAIHRSSGHPGVRHTTHLIKRICPATPRATIKIAIRTCEECQSTDPEPVHWEKGTLDVDDNWQRVGIDIMHYGAHHFLTVACCVSQFGGNWQDRTLQTWFTSWRQCFLNVAHHTNSLQIMTQPSLDDWGVNLQFHCAYIPARNGIAERCYRSVKHIAARMNCPIQEAVHWHNVTPRDSVSPPIAPVNEIYRYKVKVKGVDTPITSSGPGRSYYQVRNHVWFKTAQNRCTTKFGKGQVTKVISPQSVLVDRVPRHVKDLCLQHSVTSLEEDWWHTWERGRKPTVWHRRYRIQWFAEGRSCGRTPSRAFA